MSFDKILNTRFKATTDVTTNWDLIKSTFIPLAGEVIIYSDYATQEVEAANGETTTLYTPAMKIGNGMNYLADLPFLTAGEAIDIQSHIANNDIHITTAERSFWNNKLNYEISDQETDLLIINRN